MNEACLPYEKQNIITNFSKKIFDLSHSLTSCIKRAFEIILAYWKNVANTREGIGNT